MKSSRRGPGLDSELDPIVYSHRITVEVVKTSSGKWEVCGLVFQDLPCGCSIRGGGVIPSPLTISPCNEHSPGMDAGDEIAIAALYFENPDRIPGLSAFSKKDFSDHEMELIAQRVAESLYE